MSSMYKFFVFLPAFMTLDLSLQAESVSSVTEAVGEVAHATASAPAVSPYAYQLFEVCGFPITNAMVMSWIISLVLILAIRLMSGSGKPKLIPTKGQILVEALVEGIKDLIEPIVGKRMVKPTFPILIGFFTFILIQNWSGLLPGVGTFGFYDAHGHLNYWMRPGNSDLNMTVALAVVHFGAWMYFVLRYAGIKMLAYDLFGNKAEKGEVPGLLYFSLFFVFMFVGVIEIISILLRNISLPLRLFGNVFGGENLLTAMTNLSGFVIPVPFYFLEILIGSVQALVFTLLVAVYIGLICNHDSEEHVH